MNYSMRRFIDVDFRFWILTALFLLTIPLRWFFAAVIAAAVHELGHIATVGLLGGEITEARVGASGAKLCASPLSRNREIVCVLAGPAASLMLMLFARIAPRVAICGLVQGVYNLLPIYPLDGGKALRMLCDAFQERKIWKGNSKSKRNNSCKPCAQRVQ